VRPAAVTSRRGLVDVLLGARGTDDVGTRLGERDRDRAADAVTGARHDRDLVGHAERVENHR
jgi:hypothetical protein